MEVDKCEMSHTIQSTIDGPFTGDVSNLSFVKRDSPLPEIKSDAGFPHLPPTSDKFIYDISTSESGSDLPLPPSERFLQTTKFQSISSISYAENINDVVVQTSNNKVDTNTCAANSELCSVLENKDGCLADKTATLLNKIRTEKQLRKTQATSKLKLSISQQNQLLISIRKGKMLRKVVLIFFSL